MSLVDRKRASAPSWRAPTSKETRVRVLLLAKIRASVCPVSGRSVYPPDFMRRARSRIAWHSARETSPKERKSRLPMLHPVGGRPEWQVEDTPSTKKGEVCPEG